MKKFLRIFIIIVVLLSAIYSCAWYKIASHLEDNVQKILLAMRDQGCIVSYDDLSLRGFPFTLEVSLKNPSILRESLGNAILKIKGDLTFTSSLLHRHLLKFVSHGDMDLSYSFPTSENILSFKSTHAKGNINLWGKGLNRHAHLSLKDVIVETSSGKGSADLIELENFEVAKPTHLRLEIKGYQIISPLKLFPSFPPKIETMGLRMRYDLEKEIDSKDTLHFIDSLVSEGGTIEIEEAHMKWANICLQADGTMTLDEQKKPVVALSAHITGLSAFLQHLVSQGILKSSHAKLASLIFFPLKDPSSSEDSPIYHLPFTLQQGQVSLGPLPLFRIPPLLRP